MAALRSVRELTCLALQATLQRQPESAEEKGIPPGLPLRPPPPASSGRIAARCVAPAADLPPIPSTKESAGSLPQPPATRLACLAAATWSFDVASDCLDEIAGLRIDAATIRRYVHRAAAEAGAPSPR